MAAKLTFSMKLGTSAGLLKGKLVLEHEDGSSTDFIATSGLPGHQKSGSWLEKGRGCLPPSNLVQGGYTVTTSARMEQNVTGIQGNFYAIAPFSVTLGGVTRGDFGIHFDANVPGSAGCVVLEDKTQWAEFQYQVAKFKTNGIKSVPLTVEYK